jgi:hypothetical protein
MIRYDFVLSYLLTTSRKAELRWMNGIEIPKTTVGPRGIREGRSFQHKDKILLKLLGRSDRNCTPTAKN